MPTSWKEQRVPRDIGVRWTTKLAAAGWTPISDLFLDSYRTLEITNLEAMFLIHLLRHKWTAQMPFPGFKRLATRMGVTPTAARGYARSLEKKGLLRRVGRVGRSNAFDLSQLFERLEAVLEGKLANGSEKPKQDDVGEGGDVSVDVIDF